MRINHVTLQREILESRDLVNLMKSKCGNVTTNVDEEQMNRLRESNRLNIEKVEKENEVLQSQIEIYTQLIHQLQLSDDNKEKQLKDGKQYAIKCINQLD